VGWIKRDNFMKHEKILRKLKTARGQIDAAIKSYNNLERSDKL